MDNLQNRVEAYLDREVILETELFMQDDGDGPYIKTWNVEGVDKPTDAQLLALSTQADAISARQLWEEGMQTTDSSMPRWFEDYVTENNVTLETGKSKDSYDAKVLLRSQKP